MEVLGLIPARAGSKSVPRKNIRNVGGKPLIAHSIGHALASQRITRTIVTTDDSAIADIAREFGAEVPFLRPARLAVDTATDYGFFRHALEWLRKSEDYSPTLIVHLRPTCPVRSPARIDEAVDLLAAYPEADSLRSVHVADKNPYKMWWIDSHGLLRPALTREGMSEPFNAPRQLLPVAYWHDGYVDVTRPATVLGKESVTGGITLPFVLDEPVVDVDNADDLRRADVMLGGGRGTGTGAKPDQSFPS